HVFGELLHQMKIRRRVHAWLRVLNAEQADHVPSFDERYDDEGTGFLCGRFDAKLHLFVHARPVLDEDGTAGVDDPAENACIERLGAPGQSFFATFMNTQLEHLPLAIDEHEIKLIEAEEAARFREDALAELIDSTSAVQHAPDGEELCHRPALRIRGI